MRLLFITLIIALSSINLSAEKTKLIFDLDETLVWQASDLEIVHAIETNYPSMQKVEFESSKGRHYYFFVPFFKEMLLYFISANYEVHFFSAGGEMRNKAILIPVLTQFFGKDFYELQVSLGQFQIFSYHHMVQSLTFPDGHKLMNRVYEKQANEKGKCLKQIFPGFNLNEMILFDNLPMNGYFSNVEVEKKHYVKLPDGKIVRATPEAPGAFHCIKEEKKDDISQLPVVAATNHPSFLVHLSKDVLCVKTLFTLNHAIYFVGVVKKAQLLISQAKVPNISTRVAIQKILADHGSDQFIESYSDPSSLEHNENRDECLKAGLEALKIFNPQIKLFDDPEFTYFE